MKNKKQLLYYILYLLIPQSFEITRKGFHLQKKHFT